MATYEELMLKARELAAAGRTDEAKRVASIALKQKQPVAPDPNWADSKPPEGFVLNPQTGQMEDMRSPNNPNINQGALTAAAQGAGQGVSFGGMDEVVGGLYGMTGPGTMGQNYDYATAKMREELRRGREQYPGTSLASEVGGALTVPVGAAGEGGTLSRLVAERIGKLPVAMGKSAVQGGVLSAIYGALSGEGGLSDRASNAMTQGAVGAGIGAAIPVVGAGFQRILNNRAASKAIKDVAASAPTTDALRAEGSAAYKAIDDAGVAIKPDRVRSVMDDIAAQLRGEGAGYTGAEKVLPASRSIMEASGDVAKGSNTVPWNELDMFRRYMGNAAGANLANAGDTRAATGALTTLDDFVRNLGPNDVDAGDVETLKTMIPKARDLWARMSRSQLLDDAVTRGEGNYRTGAASGVRAQFQRILNNDKLLRGFSEPEIKLLRRVVKGSLPEQLLHYAGSGLGMVAQTAVGGIMGGGVAGAIAGGAMGAGARTLSEKVVNKNAELARAVVAAGGLKQLPKASPETVQFIEQLMRRGTAPVSQPR